VKRIRLARRIYLGFSPTRGFFLYIEGRSLYRPKRGAELGNKYNYLYSYLYSYFCILALYISKALSLSI